MSQLHPDDVAFLDGLLFSSTYLRRYCDRCKQERHTVVVGGVEAGTGPGWDIRFCRSCLGTVLALARTAAAGRSDHTPALPSLY
ncbi:hypothetical protein [Streptacidiphilus carbonis]|jgi:hypothetical protein|uniref:hypothetical protein n=1 Tax=Streptacidiphilus carbonis TaxID=105422 RepID=UPI0005AAF095|nr:hypothetical protein [Streptacidiphilus carbonis]